ncbi:glycosyltransferase family A protein [Polaromonas sp. C04]|uniref:glycosyltransferase family 2 protein n=1 Tax=Polaromonas sp. C04 TaxID=1945857 RepID=UPI001C2C6F0D|nr:glycosyltransferase family A protein [Polaromonas sp. C04]
MFTVIIPVKDRAEYLHHTLRTCSLQDYENLEIIVSDDGSTDRTREVVEEAARKDSRIRYVSPSTYAGMRDNFEFALNQVKPGYVIALGGDDGLLPYGISGMRDVLQETGQEMLAWPAPVFSYANAKTEAGQLMLNRERGGRIIQSKDFLEKQAKNLNYLSDLESPMFYVKGVTSTRLVEKVRSRSVDRRFYSCPTPDGYSGIVLAGEISSYAFSGKPFSIYGVSPTSQGMGYLASGDKATKQSEAFFRDTSRTPMHAELAAQPYSPLISLMTADYLLTARDLPGWPGNFPPIDYRDLLLKSLDELAHGLYAESRLARELTILNQIAEQHGQGEFFRKRVSQTRRYLKKEPFEGNGISPRMIFLDCNHYGIKNIFDAAYVAHYMHQIIPKVTLSSIWGMLTNSLAYRLISLRKGGRFPPDSAWPDVKPAQPPVS